MSDMGLLDNALETFESDYEFDEDLAEFLEDDERRRRAVRRRPVPTGRGTGYYRPRVANKFVTEAQLRAATDRISKDVKANAAGIKSIGVRVDAVAAEQRKQGDVLKKEIAERRKDLSKLRNNIQMSALLPLLGSKSITVKESTTLGGTPIPADTRLAVAPDALMTLLPLLLGGDGFGGGDSSNSLLLVLALSGGLK